MGRRNPQNPRYLKDDKVGSTRKSAASAKPKRSAGESAPKSSSSDSEKGSKKKSRFIETVHTPEIKRWRQRWWVFMGLALISAGMLLFEPVQESSLYQSIAVGLWIGAFGTAVYIDWGIIRKLRKAEVERLRKKG